MLGLYVSVGVPRGVTQRWEPAAALKRAPAAGLCCIDSAPLSGWHCAAPAFLCLRVTFARATHRGSARISAVRSSVGGAGGGTARGKGGRPTRQRWASAGGKRRLRCRPGVRAPQSWAFVQLACDPRIPPTWPVAPAFHPPGASFKNSRLYCRGPMALPAASAASFLQHDDQGKGTVSDAPRPCWLRTVISSATWWTSHPHTKSIVQGTPWRRRQLFMCRPSTAPSSPAQPSRP